MVAPIHELSKEIADQIELGYRVFMHKKTGHLLFVPDMDNYPDMEPEPWAKEFEELKKNSKHYNEIEKWSSHEAYEMMTEFAEQLNGNRQLQITLLKALTGKKPFREFKFVIENAGGYRAKWFEFNKNWQCDFIARKLIRIQIDEG